MRGLRLSATFAIIAALAAVTVAAASRPRLDAATPDRAQLADEGYPIDDETIIARCERCHDRDDDGRMTRISYERKTPEGWQMTLRRMVSLNNLRISPEEARDVVRYLANRQGLAPEELEPGRFEVERRIIDYSYDGDPDVEHTCIQCHSMGRVITQRRTRDEWELLLATHRGLYPLVDFQAFVRMGPPPEPAADGTPPDTRQPMDKAIDHLSAVFPLETPEWSAWSATMRPPRLAGMWALEGYEPGKGRIFGTVTIAAGATTDEFATSASYEYVESGERVRRSGQAIVYTGHQWRGRSSPGEEDELREVMSVERDWDVMTGRWFAGSYDERGLDVTLRRVAGAPGDPAPGVLGVYPSALARGAATEVRMWTVGSIDPGELDFGPGVTVTPRGNDGGVWSLRLAVDDDAALGHRDLHAGGTGLEDAILVHDGVDRIEVTPATGMARVGGANFPKGYQTFDAIGWNDGPDGEPETADDLRLGRVPAAWHLEEFAATFDDDDIDFVGTLGQDGVFTPAPDGPNPRRRGRRDNVGDVWVVATYTGPGADESRPLRARAHLLVTVPLYMRWDPWQQDAPTRLVP